MSGAAGGVTINKEDLKATIRDYRENVLKPLNLDKSYNITGIRRRPEKNVFGDIDIVVSFPGGDKKVLKQEFAQHLEQIDKIPTIPHKKNLKYFIHGSIVTTLYPISNKPGQYVQIDNIITSSEDEGKFTYNMLDLPAQEQGLALGLAKTVFTELNPAQVKQLFKDLNIPEDIDTPGEGEEYDFNLNTSELSLRIVPIGQNGGREIWKSTKFDDIKTLLKSLGIDIEKDKFEDMIQVIKKFKNRRSIDRLKGMFKRNIRVGDAEVGRDKGIAKQKAIDTVSSLEEKYNSLTLSLIAPLILEEEFKSPIAIFPGKFKPPHKDHLARIQAASKAVGPLGIVKVFISPKPTPSNDSQETIDASQSLAIFKLYQDKGLLPKNVQFQIAPDPSPVVSAYKEFETNNGKSPEEQQPYIAVFGKEEAKRFSGVSKIPNVTITDFPEANVGDESATNIRTALKNNDDISKFLPKGISPEEYKQALDIPSSLNEFVTQPELDDVERIADEWFEDYGIDVVFTRHFIERVNDKRNGKPISAEELEDLFTQTAEKYGEKLANLPDDYQAVLLKLRNDINLPFALNYDEKNDEMDLVAKTVMRKKNFQTSNPKLALQEMYAEPSEHDYPKLIKSLTEYMLDKGMNIRPLPKVKFVDDDVKNARDFFGKTAYYDPNNRVIVLYTMERHPKDVMRSYAHEMIHHMQNCDGRLGNITTQNTNEEGDLPEIEREAYEKGNMLFRNWTDSITESESLNENILNKIKEKSKDFFDALKDQKKDLEGFGPLLTKYLKDKNSLTPEENTKLKRNLTDIAKMGTLPILGVSGTAFLGAITKGKSLPSQFKLKMLKEETEDDLLAFPSTFKSDTNILVVFKENENYPNLKPLFDEYGYGFYHPESKTIILNGEDFVGTDLDFNDMKFVEAHEISHLLLGHTGPYSEDDEMDADLGAYILLKDKGLSTDKLVKEFKNRHGVDFDEKLLERVKDKL